MERRPAARAPAADDSFPFSRLATWTTTACIRSPFGSSCADPKARSEKPSSVSAESRSSVSLPWLEVREVVASA
jgi:hypothetical protein